MKHIKHIIVSLYKKALVIIKKSHKMKDSENSNSVIMSNEKEIYNILGERWNYQIVHNLKMNRYEIEAYKNGEFYSQKEFTSLEAAEDHFYNNI